jgi:3-dehydroquinate synthase
MSESFDIKSSIGSYGVHIETGAFGTRLSERHRDLILADKFFEDTLPLLLPARETIFIEAMEGAKSLDAAPELIERIRRAGANRETRFVSVGGGVLQDVCTFVASIYMRGLSWVYFPTTVLGMVDSCIGGKSSINVGPYKNLVGTYHPPQNVFIDPEVIHTLPFDQQASGIIEAAKICFCRGPEFFANYLKCDPYPGMQFDSLGRMISQSLRAKKWFIEVDEFDQKERLLLNFGHTFGHAIEGASNYGISHGIAVGLGILCALEFNRQSLLGGPDYFAGAPIIGDFESHLDTMLQYDHTLPGAVAALSVPEVMERLKSDKKHKQDSYVLILVDRTGKVVIEKVPRSVESLQRVQSAITSVLGRYAA